MTPLRQRMLDAMTVRGLAERTKECYVEAVARLARHYHRNPELLNPAEVEAYLLHLVKDRKLSYSSVNHAASASRFLFETVLGRPTDIAHLRPPMARVPQKQPELLARQEIVRLFFSCSHPVYRTVLQTVYAAGLRISEACSLRVGDIDSAADRMCVRVTAGKGGADRYSLLSPSLLALLRLYRSGPVCLNNFPRFISGLRAGCQRCRVVHGGGRRLRRTQRRGGQLGAHPISHFMQPQPVWVASSGRSALA